MYKINLLNQDGTIRLLLVKCNTYDQMIENYRRFKNAFLFTRWVIELEYN